MRVFNVYTAVSVKLLDECFYNINNLALINMTTCGIVVSSKQLLRFISLGIPLIGRYSFWVPAFIRITLVKITLTNGLNYGTI